MNSWILTMFVSSMICAFVEFLISKNELGKTLTNILKIFLLSNLLYPLKYLKLDINPINFNQAKNQSEMISKRYLKEKIVNFLKKNGIKPKSVNIDICDGKIAYEVSLNKEDEKILDKIREEFKTND